MIKPLRTVEHHVAGPSAQVAADPPNLRALLTIDVSRAERSISPCGELDSYTASALREAVVNLVQQDPGDSTLDLDGVTFIDAGGIGSVITFRNTLKTVGASLSIVGASARSRKVFVIVGLSELLTAS